VANAVEHTPVGTRVTVAADVSEDRVALHVTDDGPGISADVLPHVFEKFVKSRRDGSRADGGQGSGLGLAIAKGIMDAHGGSIAAESPVNGRGVRFTLTFPQGEQRA
jgi:two-component system sensor histidine kinase KdpD